MRVRRLPSELLRWVVKKDDSDKQKRRKEMLLVLALAMVMGGTVALVLYAIDENIWMTGTSCVVLVGGIALLLWLLVFKNVSQRVLFVCSMVLMLIVIMADLDSARKGKSRDWPYVILILDILLICQAQSRTAVTVMVLTVIWMLIVMFETISRFGLFDVFASSSDYSSFKERCNCLYPPCGTAVSEGIATFIYSVIVFGADFVITKSFAVKVAHEKRIMQNTIATSNAIASSLALFNLEEAESSLKETGLPVELHSTFHQLLLNLRMYRPFLPDALFNERNDTVMETTLSQAPGSTCEKVAILFTDIQGSTQLWNAEPDAMRIGLRLHNESVRTCMDFYDGYEVKTIGDAFMISFEKLVQAVNFGLKIQEMLLTCPWPDNLLHFPNSATDPNGLWNGVRIRAGAHYGKVDIEMNETTQRSDYFGTTVNLAARLEAVAIGGSMALANDLLPLYLNSPDKIMTPAVVGLGAVQLKGFSHDIVVNLLVPESLSKRCEFVKSKVMQRRFTEVKDNPLDSITASSIATFSSVRTCQNSTRSCLDVVTRSVVACVEAKVYPSHEDVGVVLNQSVSRVLTCLERTDGVVITVLGSAVYAGWNTAKMCLAHVENSFRFTGLLFGYSLGTRLDLATEFFVGLSCGSVWHGAVGSPEQKFVTVIGTNVRLCMALCTAAQELGTFCLYSAVPGHPDAASCIPSLQCVLRPVDMWLVKSVGVEERFPVYEVRSESIISNITYWNDTKEIQKSVPWDWSEAYSNAFFAKDYSRIASHTCDPCVVHAINLLSAKQHLCREAFSAFR